MGVFHCDLVGGVVVLRPQEWLGPGQHGVQTDDGAGSLHVVQIGLAVLSLLLDNPQIF